MTALITPPSRDLPRVHLRSELIAQGWTDQGIARARRGGVLHRVRRGAYVDHHRWAELDHLDRHVVTALAAVRQANIPTVISHRSAVALWRGPDWGLDLSEIDLTRHDMRSGRRERGVRQHRARLGPEDVVSPSGSPAVASPVRTCLDIARTASSEAALCVMNDFAHRGLLTVEQLERRYLEEQSTAGPMSLWPGSLSTRVVLRRVDPRIESVGESRLWHLLHLAGVPLPIPQAEVYDGRRLLGRVDFAWPERRVFIEFDGRAKYERLLAEGESGADALWREKRRQDLIVEKSGWWCIRLTWQDLEHPERTIARILEVLQRAAA